MGNEKGKTKAKKKKHDFHMCTSTEGTTRAFPDQKSCILMARQKDHEARNLETIDERAKIGESLENIGGRRFKEIMKDASVRDWKNMAHFSSVTCVLTTNLRV